MSEQSHKDLNDAFERQSKQLAAAFQRIKHLEGQLADATSKIERMTVESEERLGVER